MCVCARVCACVQISPFVIIKLKCTAFSAKQTSVVEREFTVSAGNSVTRNTATIIIIHTNSHAPIHTRTHTDTHKYTYTHPKCCTAH